MQDSSYLIVGGGMTAAAAVQGIREVDPHGSIALISAEQHPPYQRPPLSKKLWLGEAEETIWLPIDDAGVVPILGRRVERILPEERQVIDDQGAAYRYGKLLLATGGAPRRLPWDQGNDIIYYRTFADYQRLRNLTEHGQRFAVIGGGFIGSEIAAALRINKKDVVMIFPGESLGEHVFGPDLSQFLNGYYRERGVELRPATRPCAVERQGERLCVRTEQGQELVVDGVIAGVGIEPNVQLAKAAGLKVDNGIVVDESLRTSDPHIYAAGDVANYPCAVLGTRRRVEHEDNATAMGRCAGRVMAGAPERYDHLPSFYSDLFDLGYEAVGDLDARHDLVVDWREPYREGVIYYLKERRVRGVLLWNVWDQVEAARRLIAEPGPFDAADLAGRLPEKQEPTTA